MNDLEKLRAKLDEVDRRLLEVLGERLHDEQLDAFQPIGILGRDHRADDPSQLHDA